MTRKEKQWETEAKRAEIRKQIVTEIQTAYDKAIKEEVKAVDAMKMAISSGAVLVMKMIAAKPQEAELYRGCERDVARTMRENASKIREEKKTK